MKRECETCKHSQMHESTCFERQCAMDYRGWEPVVQVQGMSKEGTMRDHCAKWAMPIELALEKTCSADMCGDCKWQATLEELNEIIQGVGKEAPTVTNEAGGKQAKLDYRFDLIDATALFAIANVLHEGEIKYGKDNWRKIEVDSHLNHAISHIYAYLAGDSQDEHLSHACCRTIMALGVKLDEQKTEGKANQTRQSEAPSEHYTNPTYPTTKDD